MRQVDHSDVVSALNEVVDANPLHTNRDVRYSAPCVVGAAFQQLDITIPEEHDGRTVARIPWRDLGIQFQPQTITMLQRIQDAADQGSTWEQAAEQASVNA